MTLQVFQRSWPPSAIHDSVAAVLRTREFHRSLQSTIGERLLSWIAEGFDRAVKFLRGVAPGRSVALSIAVVIVALVVARMIVGARLRDREARERGRESGARGRRGEDPWRAADRLAHDGDYEGAAHALYHAVLTSVAERERLRLDPSLTSGDYARELRRRDSSAHQSFRAFARRFDAGVFGHRACDAAFIDDLRGLAAPFAPPARAA